MARVTTLKKPSLSTDDVLAFAEGKAPSKAAAKRGTKSSAVGMPVGQKAGLVPEGDVRLTANIDSDLHMKLKMRAVQERTTIGELIENWIKGW